MYRRNFLYISEANQKKIKNFRILIGGCGLGSVIAECALRLGFENLTVIDGDKVELSNLNRQNYTQKDIGRFKVEALKERLLEINPCATIFSTTEFLTKENIAKHIKEDYDLAINTIDFTSDIPFLFDDICCRMNIPVLHPLNLGWGASVIVVNCKSRKLRELYQSFDGFEVYMAQHILNELDHKKVAPEYLGEVIKKYSQMKNEVESPPQLSVGSWTVASMCTRLMYCLCIGKGVNTFPEVYFQAIE